MNRSTKILTVLVLVFSYIPLAGALPIEEISVDSVDTTFDFIASPVTDSELRIEQSGVTVVVEKAGNVQEEISGAYFSLVTNLTADNSTSGKAVGDFAGGTITIKDAMNVLLISANISNFSMEENATLPFCVLAGSGTFLVTDGTWEDSFGPEGIIFELTWKLDSNIGSFSEDFTAESDVTLTPIPEPTALSLIGLGGLTIMRRRRK